MESSSLLQLFAKDKNGRMRSIDEVSRGLSCECTCTCCGEKVIARQGEVREWHFAHASEADCAGAAESALHQAAKQILLDNKGTTLPERSVDAQVTLADGRKGIGYASRPELWLDFDTVEAEVGYDAIRPDIVATINGTSFFFEVAVTHFIDEEKRKSLHQHAVPTIEIDLAQFTQRRWDWELLHEVVVESAIYKSWILVWEKEMLQAEAQEEAIKNAMSKSLHLDVAVTKPASAQRTRFWIGQRMVDVIERPFGLAIWSPYDPVMNAVIKDLMRTVGGRWQPKFKNWLAPSEAKDWLFQELLKLSGNVEVNKL